MKGLKYVNDNPHKSIKICVCVRVPADHFTEEVVQGSAETRRKCGEDHHHRKLDVKSSVVVSAQILMSLLNLSSQSTPQHFIDKQ